jgi:hypothetical protein
MEREPNERRDLPEINLDFQKTTIFVPSPPFKDSSPNSPSPSPRGLQFREENLRDWIGFLRDWIRFLRDWIGFLRDWIRFLRDWIKFLRDWIGLISCLEQVQRVLLGVLDYLVKLIT